MQLTATKSSSNFRYKFWEHEKHPVLLVTTEMYNQRLNYLHYNLVTASYVTEPWHWLYSSVIDFFKDKKGQLDLVNFGWLLGAEISNKEYTGQSPTLVE